MRSIVKGRQDEFGQGDTTGSRRPPALHGSPRHPAYVAAKLALADHLANQPMSGAQLAVATSTDPASLRRILRALVALGVLAETDTGAFALTPVGHLLRTDHPGSLRAPVLFMTGDVRW